jgi:hypothetical protein
LKDKNEKSSVGKELLPAGLFVYGNKKGKPKTSRSNSQAVWV